MFDVGPSEHMEIVVSVSSVVIALAALFVAVWQGITTRQHNRRSVTPHLVVVRTIKPRVPQIDIRLKNNGVGPAMLREVDVTLDGEAISDENCEGWPQHLRTLSIPYKYCEVDLPAEGSFIPAGYDKSLLMVETKDDDFDPFEMASQLTARLRIRLQYESIYGEKHECEMDSVAQPRRLRWTGQSRAAF